jgi:hypothetical protein
MGKQRVSSHQQAWKNKMHYKWLVLPKNQSIFQTIEIEEHRYLDGNAVAGMSLSNFFPCQPLCNVTFRKSSLGYCHD